MSFAVRSELCDNVLSPRNSTDHHEPLFSLSPNTVLSVSQGNSVNHRDSSALLIILGYPPAPWVSPGALSPPHL